MIFLGNGPDVSAKQNSHERLESNESGEAYRPTTCLPPWGVDDLPDAKPIRWSHWKTFIGPGIVMMGAQIAGGEWLFGPEMTAKYGGSLMWFATIAIVVQVFYNIECGRYALYCGEPIFTGFLRTKPGPMFWTAFFIFLTIGAIIPGMAFHAGSVMAGMHLGRPPVEDDRGLVVGFGYLCLVIVVVPVFFGGKIYNVLQAVMATKVLVVLGFCLLVGVCFGSPETWFEVITGFFKFGSVPVEGENGEEVVVNLFTHYAEEGAFPIISMANIAVLGAFAGYAGGGGLGNSLYSNYVRDKGWGMGSRVGAIPSAVGGNKISLSHLGKVFPVTGENLRRWKVWWRYILTDQLLVWAPGCFVGMALPAVISLEFAQHSELFQEAKRFDWAQALVSADGIRHAPQLIESFSPGFTKFLWLVTLFVGLMVLLPSQMSVVEDVSRRWTDVIWSGSKRVREKMKPEQVSKIYYTILISYFVWCLISMTYFGFHKTPKLMVLIIANLGNVAIGLTAFFILYVNTRYLPPQIRPGLLQKAGLIACGVFYLGMAALVYYHTQKPIIDEFFFGKGGS